MPSNVAIAWDAVFHLRNALLDVVERRMTEKYGSE